MEWLNLAAWIPCTEAEGPGKRAALWVQGCDKRCTGCCNPGFLRVEPRRVVAAAVVARYLVCAQRRFGIDGVTFLGGEPFLQAQGLGAVAKMVSARGLSVMTFTGYTVDELSRLGLRGTERLLAHTDVLVDGPYERSLPERERNWVGSSNQRFHYRSQRYDATIERAGSAVRHTEWRIGQNGLIRVNGWPVRVS